MAGSGGIKQLELCTGDRPFRLYCLQSATGVKVLLTVSGSDRRLSDPTEIEKLMKRAYQVYTDYALKNAFQPLDMPIKSELFDDALIKSINL